MKSSVISDSLRGLMLTLLLALLASCSDDDPISSPAGGSIESEGGQRVTVVHLTTTGTDLTTTGDEASFMLIDPANRKSYDFKGLILNNRTVSHNGRKGSVECRLRIGSTDIADGDYYLTVTADGLPELGLRMVRFRDNLGSEIPLEPMGYDDLTGSGTPGDPYLINDAGDFLTLLWYLEEDPLHAAGLHFLQTASFDLPHRSQIIDGHVWVAATFAGHYDGGDHELRKLVYQGASDANTDHDIGLFARILGGSVENVSITGALLTNVHSYAGLIAGSTMGDVALRNITVEGTITASGQYIGGLTGSSMGNIIIENVRLNSLVISGGPSSGSIGGVTGAFCGKSAVVRNVSTPDHIFSLTGNGQLGGLFGSSSAMETLEISGIRLEHSVDHESSGTKIIAASGNYAGGLGGIIYNVKDVAISDVAIKAPVSGGRYVAAFVGEVHNVARMSVGSILLTSVARGTDDVGGFFGLLNLADNESFSFASGSSPSRYVVKSSAEADVKGNARVGGLIGHLEAVGRTITFGSEVEIAVNVSGKESVGGAFGQAGGLKDLDPTKINFSSPTMRVTASSQYAGGVVGKLDYGSLTGPLRLDLTSMLPGSSMLPSNYQGVVTAPQYAGGIAGYSSGEIKGLGSNASVTATGNNAGGICGWAAGPVSHCAFFGSVSGADHVGGVIGGADSGFTFTELLNRANISDGKRQGGIVAYITQSKDVTPAQIRIERCFNTGNLTGGVEVGGIAGYVYEHRINNSIAVDHCVNTGDIRANGNSGAGVGGVAGYLNSMSVSVSSCANHGDISSSAVQYSIGGVVGVIGDEDYLCRLMVERCMNSGTISSSVSSTKLGGVVGHMMRGDAGNAAIIRDCYNLGAIPSDQKDDTGGILGLVSTSGDIHRTFNRGKISHGNAIIGTHHGSTIFYHSHNYYLEGSGKSWPSSTSVPESRITDKSYYKDFDFDNVWTMTSDGPILRDCPFQSF